MFCFIACITLMGQCDLLSAQENFMLLAIDQALIRAVQNEKGILDGNMTEEEVIQAIYRQKVGK